MDEQTKLILALYQVDGITQLTKDNEYRQFIFMHLNSIKYELERQLTNLTIVDKIKGNLQTMMTKYFYIVDHFVPFPQSEYGGIWNVIANDDEECFNLIAERDDGINQSFYNRLRENVNKAPTFVVADGSESQVVEEFIT